MIYGYVRVSTEEQNLQNQTMEISKSYHVDEWFEDKKSGTIDYHKRSLGNLITKLQKGDILVVTEISRLGRSLTMIFKLISELYEKGVKVIAIKNNFETDPLNPNDITSSVLMFAFGLSAQLERDLISERTKQGLAVARMKGKRIGRKKGEVIYNVKLRPYQSEIMEKYSDGFAINALAKEYNVKWITMKNFITKYSKMKKN